MRRPAWWGLAVAGVCVVAAVVATWPLATRLTGAIPMGTEHEATVPVFSLWTLWWTSDRAIHGFSGYWDAPFFHPHQGVFAFSEPLILPGLLSTPLWAVSAPPALTYNLLMLGMLAGNGIFTYRLARALAATRPAALLGAVLAVTLPVVAKLYGVLPIVPLFGGLWTLEGLVRFSRTGRTAAAAWAGAGFIMQYLLSQQLALLFAPFALGAAMLTLSERRFQGRALAVLAATGLGVTATLACFAVPTQAVRERYGFERSETTVQALSARGQDFLTRPSTALVRMPPADDSSKGDTGGLFPGVMLLALAAAGTLVGLRHRASRRWTLYLALTALLAAFLATGLNLELLGWRPFATLRAHVPGMRELRSVFRFAAVAQAMLAVLAALAFSQAQRLLPLRAALTGSALLALVGAAENLSIPQPLVAVPASPRSGWSAWIGTQPESSVIAHIPFPAGLHVSDYEADAWRMFAQIDHRKRMLNGYSSNFPPGYGHFQLQINQEFPDYNVLCYLYGRLGVNLLAVDRPWLAAHGAAMEAEGVRALVFGAYEDTQVRIYRLSPPPGHCVAAP